MRSFLEGFGDDFNTSILYAPDDPPADPPSGESKGGIKGELTSSPLILSPDTFDSFRGMVRRAGSIQHAAETLFNENAQLREEKRQANEDLTTARSENVRLRHQAENKTPTEEQEELALWRELGEDPKKVKEKIDSAANARQENERLKNLEKRRKAATLEGYDAEGLAELGAGLTFTVEEVEEEVEGKKQKVERGFVVTKKEGGAEGETEKVLVGDYLEDHYPRLEPGLRAGDDNGKGGSKDNERPVLPRQRRREREKGGGDDGGEKRKKAGRARLAKSYGAKKE